MLRIKYLFAQIKRQQVIDSSYEQLVNRIAQNYNLKQYKNQSGLCLLEMHHQFNIFQPGDWVLDVGAGKNYAWTDLALKLTQNQQLSHMVISNDILDLKKTRQNHQYIKGDFNQQPVRTNIALKLQQNLDTVLIDVSPEYTGSINQDARYIMGTISNVLEFSQDFLSPGGTVVCKMLQSQSEELLSQTFDVFFNEKYKYVPSIMRSTSPVCFYVLKGFLMSQNYTAIDEFATNYKGSPQRKIKLVQKYSGKFSWDPVKTAKKLVLNSIIQMKNQNRSDKDIIQVFGSDPYTKPQRILKLLKQIEQAQKDRNSVVQAKLINQLTNGDIYKSSVDFPTTKEEFYQKIVETMQKTIKESTQRKKEKFQKQSRAPLKQGESYMKVKDQQKQVQQIKKTYTKGDLLGLYSQEQSTQQSAQQLQKIQTIHPEIQQMMDQFQQSQRGKSDKTIQDILDENKKKYDQLGQQKLRVIQEQVLESIRNMTDQQRNQQRKMDAQMQRSTFNEGYQRKQDRFVNQRRSKRKKPIY